MDRVLDMLLLYLWLFLAFGSLASGQNPQWNIDPVSNFCRRFGHATAVVDHKLYIDGGVVNWQLGGPLRNATNRNLLYNDLNYINPQNKMPQLYGNLTKNRTDSSVVGGALFADSVNKYLFQYGGESRREPRSPTDGMAIYDILSNSWNHTKIPWRFRQIAWGASTTVEERGEGYILGGLVNNGTNPGMIGQQATANLLRFDMSTRAWTNLTGPDQTGRAEGAMVFLPASDSGLLVYFGGILDPAKNGTMIGSPMNTIYIYDIASSKWYTQSAAGDIPQARRRFCAGATYADDHSSYNIYLYGGLGIPPDGVGFDDVYVLSLPSFQWIRWWPTTPGEGNPHHSMTCNVINRSQMIIIGGEFPNQDTTFCDTPEAWGTHNLNLGKNGPANAIWDTFFPNISTYSVPPEIIARIGGGPSGGATVVKPAAWDKDTRDLSVYFSRVPRFAARTPTRSVPIATGQSKSALLGKQRAGVIAGAAVGGIILIVLLVFALFCFVRLRHARHTQQTNLMARAELPTNATPDPHHLILGADGKPLLAELEQKADSARHPSGSSVHSESPISPPSDLQSPSFAVLHDSQTRIDQALDQLHAQADYQLPLANPQSPGDVLVVPSQLHDQCVDLPYGRYVSVHQYPMAPSISPNSPEIEPEGQENMKPPTNYDESLEERRFSLSPTPVSFYPQPLRVIKPPSRNVSKEVPPGSAI